MVLSMCFFFIFIEVKTNNIFKQFHSIWLPLSAIPLRQHLPCHLWLSINLYVTGCLDCTVGEFYVSIPTEPFLFQDKVQILNAKLRKYLIRPDGDSVLRFELQLCLIIALSFRCRRWRFGFVNGQVTLAWSSGLHTQELYMRPRVLAGRENS